MSETIYDTDIPKRTNPVDITFYEHTIYCISTKKTLNLPNQID